MKKSTKSMLAVTSLTAATLYGINLAEQYFATKHKILANSSNNTYVWQFGNIYYNKTGEGSPLLLLHDLIPGSSSYEFHRIVTELSERFTVYTLDLIGYGKSDKIKITYTNSIFTRLIHDFIREVIGKRTNVIASGKTASIAVALSQNAPDIFDKIILLNPEDIDELNAAPSPAKLFLKNWIDMPLVGTFIYNLFTGIIHTTEKFKLKYFYNPLNIDEKDVCAYREASHIGGSKNRYVFSSYISGYMSMNIVHAMKEINNSITIIAGAEKEGIDSIIDKYVELNPSIEVIKVPVTKQLPHLESPETVLMQLHFVLK